MKIRRLTWVSLVGLAIALASSPMVLGQQKGGRLVIGRPADAISLDSNTDPSGGGGQVQWNIIEPLMHFDANCNIEPGLATDYKVVAPDRVRFFLRKGVKFHDGTPLNAEAVKFTYDRAITMPARWKSLFGPLKAAEVVDEYTVDIITDGPFGPILASTALPQTGIISPTAVKKYGEDYGAHPVGTGPFKFKEWKAKDHITLVRNEDYWGQKAYVDEVVFRVIPEAGARMMALLNGEVDLVIRPNPSELPLFRKDPKFIIAETLGLRVFYLGFHNQLPPTDDVRVRRALLMAVDLKGILDNILEEMAEPATSYIAPGVFGYKDMELQRRYPYDLEKAKALLDEAGWKDTDGDGILDKKGEKLTLRFLGVKNRYLMDAEICEAVQAQFRAVGADCKLEFYDWGATFNLLCKPVSPYNLHSMGQLTTTADANYTLYAMFHSKQMKPEGWNLCRFVDPKVDKLLEEGRYSLDQEKRKAVYQKVQDILADAAPWIAVYNTKETYVLNKWVKGFVAEASEYQLTMRNVWLEK